MLRSLRRFIFLVSHVHSSSLCQLALKGMRVRLHALRQYKPDASKGGGLCKLAGSSPVAGWLAGGPP